MGLKQISGGVSQAALDAYVRKERFDIRDYDAVSDEVYFTGSIDSGTTTLTRSSGTFTSADIGKRVSIPGAGNSGGVYAWNTQASLPATITDVDGNEATISVPAVADATNVTVQMATDCTAAIQAALDDAGAVEGSVVIPQGRWHAWQLHPPAGIDIVSSVGPGSTLVTSPQDFTTTSSNNGGLIGAYASLTSPYGSDSNRLENVGVYDLGIDGNLYRHTGDISNRTKGEGINFRWGLNCRAERCRIKDTTGDGIDFDETKYSYALNNIITGVAGWGIHHSNGNVGNVIIGNFAENCGHVMALTTGGGQGGFDSGALSTDLTFLGNTAKDNYRNYSFTGTGNRVFADGSNKSIDTGDVVVGDVFSAIGPANLPGADTTFEHDVVFDGLATFNDTVNLAAILASTLSATSSTARRYRVTGDTADRHNVRANGDHYWGDGSTTGTGDVVLGRKAADTLGLNAGDHFKLDGTWNGGRLLLGSNHVWVDASGFVRVKSSAPSSDLDGVIVGDGTAPTYPSHVMFNVFGTAAAETSWTSVAPLANRYNNAIRSATSMSASVSFDAVMKAGTWAVDVLYATGTDGGIVTVTLDGATLGTVDMYAASAAAAKQTFTGVAVGSTGLKRITLTITGANASSSANVARLSGLSVTRTGA